jgi:hypothetical protein
MEDFKRDAVDCAHDIVAALDSKMLHEIAYTYEFVNDVCGIH